MAERPPKKLVFCFDGTSNTLDRPHPTNVAITAAAVRNSSKAGPQIVYYDEGVGSGNWRDKIVGGAVGKGLYDRVIEAYKFLVFNHEPGDEIFIFGFSRGAYTARSFAGLIHHVGVVNSCYAEKIHVAAALYQNRNAKAAIEELDDLTSFRREFVPDSCASVQDRDWRYANVEGFDPSVPLVNIKYIGVWDTVKTIGDPMLGDRDGDGEYDAAEFHDHHLYPEVESARHAVAIDERRKKFNVTLWENIDQLNGERGAALDDPDRPYQQLWFPGGHGSVGGGGDVRGLSDEGLEWILEGAKRKGLAFDISTYSKIWGIRPDALAPLENSSGKKSWAPADVIMRNLPKMDRDGPNAIHEVSPSAIVRWAAPPGPGRELYRPRPLARLEQEMNAAAQAYADWEFAARGGFEGDDLPAAVDDSGNPLRRYTVQSGQTLERIAAAELGDAGRVAEILALNRTTILDPDRYYAGQIVNLPAA
jgi:uncharacterized protein (DUF2235 family)